MSDAFQSASPDELVDEITKIRDRLSNNIDELIDRARPKAIARRRLENTKSRFVDPAGNPRFENIVPVVLALAGTVGTIVVIRRLLG